MSAKKTERLLNLVICLLATRRFLSVHQIREAVPGYASTTEEAFRRMFERDKEELRELGVPLETGSHVAAHEDEVGYRIARRDYELPEVVLEPDEAAALGLAARLWQSAPLAGATASALLKLQAAGIDVTPVSGALEPRVGASEPAFVPALQAVRDAYPVRFGYRTARQAPGEPPQQRRVQPWGVVSWHGRWYLVGYDEDRQATRVFRLSRVMGRLVPDGPPGSTQVPEGVDLRALVARMAEEPAREVARVRVRAGTCHALRQQAAAVPAAPGEVPPDGAWEVLEVGYSEPERLAERVTGFGGDAVVLSPPAARSAVVERLRAVLAATESAPAGAPVTTGPVEQLPRLLALVPYLLGRPGVRMSEVAQVFGVTEDRLRKDLDLLWVCGLPGHGPGDLIDVEFEGDTITLFEPQGVTRPLRLTVDEALALVVALRALVETPGLVERDALDRALAKVERVAGEAAAPAGRVEVAVEGDERVLPVVERALAEHRRLHLSYHNPSRDETTERDVDPMRLAWAEGRPYLEAWCLRAEGVRLFRLDRVTAVELLDVPADLPPQAASRDLSQGVFQPRPDDALVVLALSPEAHWVVDHHPCESVEDVGDGVLVARLRTPDPRWVRRLLLRLGDRARVLEPAELAAQVRADALAALSAYGEST